MTRRVVIIHRGCVEMTPRSRYHGHSLSSLRAVRLSGSESSRTRLYPCRCVTALRLCLLHHLLCSVSSSPSSMSLSWIDLLLCTGSFTRFCAFFFFFLTFFPPFPLSSLALCGLGCSDSVCCQCTPLSLLFVVIAAVVQCLCQMIPLQMLSVFILFDC